MRAIASAVLGFGLLYTSCAFAMDPVCQQLMGMEKAMATTPFHIAMTKQESYRNQTLAKAGAQLGLAGAQRSEEISTVKDVYVLQKGKWIDMQMNFMQMSDPNDPDVKKAHEAARCHMLPDAIVAGQPASGYEELNAPNGSDSKIWISKLSHLPLKSEIVIDTGPMTMITTSIYDYRNVSAPSGAITMQQMMQQHH